MQVWLGCGILGTFGALVYAEVGTMIPKSGGEFPIFLKAFGPVISFLFAWISGTVLKPSSLALGTLTFAKYALSPVYSGAFLQISYLSFFDVKAMLCTSFE